MFQLQVLVNVTSSSPVHQANSGASETSLSKVLDAVPLLLAAFYYLMTPFFVKRAQQGYIDYLEKINKEWDMPDQSIPAHLKPDFISSNTDWLIDASQMTPTLLLPLAAAVFVLNDETISGIVLAFASIVICAAALWIYFKPPQQYRALRFVRGRYTLVPALGTALNVAAALFVIFK